MPKEREREKYWGKMSRKNVDLTECDSLRNENIFYAKVNFRLAFLFVPCSAFGVNGIFSVSRFLLFAFHRVACAVSEHITLFIVHYR